MLERSLISVAIHLSVVLTALLGVQSPEIQQEAIPSANYAVTVAQRNLDVPEVIQKGVPKDQSKRCPHFEDLFRQYDLKPVDTFSYIAWRESRCNPSAVNAKWRNGKIVWTLNKNGSYDSGLLQINSSWKTVTKNVCGGGLKRLLDVDCNLKVAKYLMDNSSNGLGNWNL